MIETLKIILLCVAAHGLLRLVELDLTPALYDFEGETSGA
jgi:hypothetical protein